MGKKWGQARAVRRAACLAAHAAHLAQEKHPARDALRRGLARLQRFFCRCGAAILFFRRRGLGLMDLAGYNAYLAGKLTDYEPPEEDLRKFTAPLKNLPKAEMRKTGKW